MYFHGRVEIVLKSLFLMKNPCLTNKNAALATSTPMLWSQLLCASQPLPGKLLQNILNSILFLIFILQL